MKKISAILFVILFYSCGDNSTGSPANSGYWDEDQDFLDDLYETSGLNEETLADSIESVIYNWAGENYYRIQKLHLSNLDLDSLPPSIGNLDSLKILSLNNNNLKYLPNSICSVYVHLESLEISNNDICTPNVPDCIFNSMTLSDFYDNQQCTIIPDEEDQDFISDLINENWGDTVSTELINELNNLTTWESFIEGSTIKSRITEIRYDSKGIIRIPNSISDLDSLSRIELQDNAIDQIPGYVGSLSRLNYFTIQKNIITFLPPQIGSLKKLEVFKISENQLIEVHQNIGQLSKLNILHLSENQLTTLPDSMCNILTNPGIFINVDYNQICSEYPDCFAELIENSTQEGCP